MKELIITQKKSAYVKLLLACLLPGVIFAYFLWKHFSGAQVLGNGMFLLFSLSFTLCLGAMIYFLIKYLDKKPALVINQKGIIDNISMAKAGFIPWSNINGCLIGKLSGVDQLMIKVKDHKSIMEQQSSLRKSMLQVPIQDHGTPIAINVKLLDYNPEKLLKVIKRKRV